MGVFCYLRVSTVRQEVDKNKYEVLEYANNKKMGAVKFYEDTISGTVKWQARQMGKIVEQLGKGDILIVPELSRLARSISQIYEIVEAVRAKGAELHIIKQGLIFSEGKNDMQTKVMLSTFALMAELERDFISIRTREALHAKKLQGVKLGRAKGSGLKLTEHKKEIEGLLNNKVSVSAIARIYKVNRATVSKFITEHIEQCN
jgi:putative DNA-invertase from lambdoid prophage Rac